MSVKDFIDQEYMCLDDDYLDAVTERSYDYSSA